MAVNNPAVNPLKPKPESKPIPPWVFFAILAAVLVGGAILIGYLRSRSSSTSSASTTNTTTGTQTPPSTTTSGTGDIVNMQAFDTLESAYGNQFTENQQAQANNTQLQAQLTTLESQLTTAQQTGQNVTALQAQIAALQQELKNPPAGPQGPAGPPGPQGPAGPASPPPAPTPPASSAKTFRVTTWPQPGSSLWSIAQIEYGNGALWPRIFNANPTIHNPNLIYPGQVLTIP